MSVENHARAVLARLVGAHHLPVAPDGITWSEPYDQQITPTDTIHGRAVLWVNVATDADVDVWAATLKAVPETDDRIDTGYKPDAWLVHHTRQVVIRDWLPGARLWVRHSETREAFAPKGATR